MEAQNLSPTEQAAMQSPSCAECLEAISQSILTIDGSSLCTECATTYYTACSVCRGLLPKEELLTRDGSGYCGDCFNKATLPPDMEPMDEEEMKSLIMEYVELNAKCKRLSDRLDEIKEKLKTAASTRQRIGNAVILRGGDLSVRCGYSVRLKCDPERTSELENVLAAEQFAALFERKVTFSPNKENLEEFLSSEGDGEIKEAVQSVIEATEVVALTVPKSKKK